MESLNEMSNLVGFAIGATIYCILFILIFWTRDFWED